MSEREDLFAIYGAIDRAVAGDRKLQDVVSKFLPEYNDADAIGWFDEFERWAGRIPGTSPLPEFEDALRNLAGQSTTGRMAARRLLAMAVAARVFDTNTDESSDIEVSIGRALAVGGITTGVDSAPSVLLFLKSDVFGSIRDWSDMITKGVESDILDSHLAVQAAVAPCDCVLVEVSAPGDDFPATELKTHFEVPGVTLQQAQGFLDPSKWPGCSDFWCKMQLKSTDADGTRHYHEEVSLDCHNPAPAWSAAAELRFVPRSWPGGASVTYGLEPGVPNTLIDVDEGTLVVQELPGGAVMVDTIKRIRFTHPFNGPALSMVMCALGYAHVAEDLVLDCAGNHPPAKVPFPGSPDTGANEAGERFRRTVGECIAAGWASSDKMLKGKYTPGDLVTDVASSWLRYLRGASAVVDLAMQTMGTCPKPETGPSTAGPSTDVEADATPEPTA